MAPELSSTYGKLNLGCGADPKPDYLNVDIRRLPDVNVVADIRHLHFTEHSFSEILARDIIEHLSYRDASHLLTHCHRWLQPDGVLKIHTGNLSHILYLLMTENDEEALRWLFGSDGSQDTSFEANYHRWCYSVNSLTELVKEIGFTVEHRFTDCNRFGLGVVARKE